MKSTKKFKNKVIAAMALIAITACSASQNDKFVTDNISAQSADNIPLRFKAPGRIVAIGDLHGDFQAARQAFRLAGATNAADHWAGGNLVVVQTGDHLDRGDGEREIEDFLERLTNEAAAAGGALHVLNGNHEIMNVSLDFRYVTNAGFGEFEGIPGLNFNIPALKNIPPVQRPRAAAFYPGGPFANLLAGRNTIVIVNDILFVHGGILPKYVSYGLEKINREVRQWMKGENPVIPPAVTQEDSPVWNRQYSDESAPNNCGLLNQALNLSSVKYMVVGHTIQDKGINPACNGNVWRIDVGMSKAYGGPIQVLEILNNKFRVLKLNNKI
jgi:hypothetical protein